MVYTHTQSQRESLIYTYISREGQWMCKYSGFLSMYLFEPFGIRNCLLITVLTLVRIVRVEYTSVIESAFNL